MNDVAGLIFFALLAAMAWLGLRSLSKGRTRTEQEFERGAAQSASLIAAGMNALHGMLDPSGDKGRRAVREFMTDGSRRRSSAGGSDAETSAAGERKEPNSN